MKVELEYNGIPLEIKYDEKGMIESVKNLLTDSYMILSFKTCGRGYNIDVEKTFIDTIKCEAVYAYLIEMDIFIPLRIFIKND